MAEQKGVDAVERALTIMDCFASGEGPISLADLSRQTGLYKSTILRLAVSLERFGYLIREEGSRFRLGPTTWQLGGAYRHGFDLAKLLRPQLQNLSDQTGETASFYVREGEHRVCLLRVEPARSIRHALIEGAKLPLNKGATSKILLAFSDDPSEGDNAIRNWGFAVSKGERDPEVAAISVPIMDTNGKLFGALAVSGLITRFTPDQQPKTLETLKASRKEIEAQLV